MVKEYLNALKTAGNFSWSDLSKLSGLPDATIRKVFSGETADPRMETVVKLVTAMGGSMDELVSGSKKEETEMNAIMGIRELYEARIKDIKTSSDEYMNSLKRDKRHLWVAVCVLGAFVILFLLMDILVGNVGWIRF
ncbi:MAG: helix-turn-helix transcriptional regulator [Oscillospiraceae bacterium]|nr:helix-turn-helix transcriptional regulator [Oscillospiraceae bacterium]